MSVQRLASNYDDLAELFKFLRQYQKALSLFHKSIRMKEIFLGREYIDTLEGYNNLAVFHMSINEPFKAIPLYEKALKVIGILDENHVLVATVYMNIGSLYYAIDDYEKAYFYLSKCVSIRKSILPNSHPYLLEAKNRLKLTIEKLG